LAPPHFFLPTPHADRLAQIARPQGGQGGAGRRPCRFRPEAGRKLVEHFPDEIWPALNAVVAGYRPIHDEIDPTPLMETFHCEQARLALPCVVTEPANR
jgi:hypothetical protein